MMFTLTYQLVLKAGIWCDGSSRTGCSFDWGGLFITTTARKVLFTGFNDPMYIKYYNMKLKLKGISMACAENSADACGVTNYRCNDAGIVMSLPNGFKYDIAYNQTPSDKFFAPYLEVADDGEMLWENAVNEEEVSRAAAVKRDVRGNSSRWIERLVNPYFALYPSWTADRDVNKHFQCQKRTFGGPAGVFGSCLRRVRTGRKNLDDKDEIVEFMGNTTIRYFLNQDDALYPPVPVRGKVSSRQRTYGWDGFFTYPYAYAGSTTGADALTLPDVTYFEDQVMIAYTLDQKEIDKFLCSIDFSYPLVEGIVFSHDCFSFAFFLTLCLSFSSSVPAGPPPAPAASRKASRTVRRFTESKDTWKSMQLFGKPLDSYGMPYTMPMAMMSIERQAGFPVFVSTNMNYGNRLWGGTEWMDVVGRDSFREEAYAFMDYDPVTGYVLRQAIRPQINLRVERGPLLVNLAGSQDRCVAPTRQYLSGQAYGCYVYVPLIWYEDAKIISESEYFNLVDHFYSRPARVQVSSGLCLFTSHA